MHIYDTNNGLNNFLVIWYGSQCHLAQATKVRFTVTNFYDNISYLYPKGLLFGTVVPCWPRS